MANYTPIQEGMKGIVVANVTNANFQKIWDRLNQLEAENAELRKTAMIGNNGTGGITEDAVVNVMYSPQTIIAKTESEDIDYYVDVKVMCGNKELLVGEDSITQFTFEPGWDTTISEAGMIANITKVESSDKRLRLKVTVKPGAISDGSFDFYVKYRDVKYNYTINVVVINGDSGVEYAQGVFMSTIFTRSDTQPLTPTGGDYNLPLPTTLSTGDAYQGWHDGIPSGTKPLWTSHRRFTNNGKSPQESAWSVPILAMDSADFDVCFTSGTTRGDVPRPPENHGDQDLYDDPCGWHNIGNEFDVWMATSVKNGNQWGEWSVVKIKGEDGSMSDWKDTIYKKSAEQPATPTNKKPATFVGKENIAEPNDGWVDAPNDNGTWWMSVGYVNGGNGEVESWTTPTLAAGGTGQGVFKSTVFIRSLTKPSRPTGGNYSNPIPTGGQWSDGIPDGNSNSAPVWCSYQTFTSDDMSPATHSWSEPVMMVDTADFDCCFSAYSGTPEPPGENQHGNQDNYNTSPYNWHNVGTSDDIWMATSSKPANSTQWSTWVVTQIKGESGKNGNYTNYIFKASSASTVEAPNILTPSNFVDKADEQITNDYGVTNNEERNRGWVDGPGVDYENDNISWWMSCAVIDGSTAKAMDAWSTPIPMDGRDGAYMEFRYGINTNEVDPPEIERIDDDEYWSDSVSGALHTLSEKHRRSGDLGINEDDYENVPSNHFMWMAMRRHVDENGVLKPQPWEYCRVTGEKGESGTKLNVKDSKSTYRDLFLIAVDENNQKRSKLPEDGDSYVVMQNMWVWSEAAEWISGNSETEVEYGTSLDPAKWKNCGPIVGPSGAATYLHIKYAETCSQSGVTPDGQVFRYPTKMSNSPEGCRWMGTHCGNTLEAPDIAPSAYTWSMFAGEDGYGYEYIYRLSETNEPDFSVPTRAQCTEFNGKKFDDNDYVPSGWTDNPTGISVEYPFEFMASRIRENGVWQDFKGKPTDTTSPILYLYRGKDLPYEQREWAVFGSLVFTEEMRNDNHWYVEVPSADEYKHDYLWRRIRTVTPPYGSQTGETYGEWEYIRDSGEKGNDGTGIQLDGTCESLGKLFDMAYSGSPEPVYDENLIKDGAAYTVSGNLWVWNTANTNITTANTDDQGNTVDYGTNTPCHHWRNGGEIKGEKGDTYYKHIKFANTASAVTEEISGVVVTKYYVTKKEDLTTKITPYDGELPGRYIGICYNVTKEDPDPIENRSYYDWTRYTGDDGLDYEMIYTRTKTNVPPPVPEITGRLLNGELLTIVADEESGFTSGGTPVAYRLKRYTESDFIPCYEQGNPAHTTSGENGNEITEYNWTDNPMGPNEEYKWEWAARRDKEDGKWTDFYGRADSTNLAFLYNKFGDSSVEINIPDGQFIYYSVDTDGKTIAIDKTIVFVVSKDGETMPVSSITFGNVDILNDGSPITSGMSDFFSTYEARPNGDENIHGPYIHLRNEPMKLDKNNNYSFSCTLLIGGVEYKKTFSFLAGAKDGKDGESPEPLIEYRIEPDVTALKMNSVGGLEMDPDGGINIACYINSGDTTQWIDFSVLNDSVYQLKYSLDDSASETTAQRNTQTGANAGNAIIPYNQIKNIEKQVVIRLYKRVSTTSGSVNKAIQTITIPAIYDGQNGSRNNLFGWENPLTVLPTSQKNSQIMHTDTGFAALLYNNGQGPKWNINIYDNPYESKFIDGEKYLMSGKIRFKKISGSTDFSAVTYVDYCDDTTSGTEKVSISANYTEWYDLQWKTSSIDSHRPKITLSGTTGSSIAERLLVEVGNLKIERVRNDSDSATQFEGLAISHMQVSPNLFQGSGALRLPFTVPPRGEMANEIEKYAYCNNHAIVAYNKALTSKGTKDSYDSLFKTSNPQNNDMYVVGSEKWVWLDDVEEAGANSSAYGTSEPRRKWRLSNGVWDSFLQYQTVVTTGKYYTVSWYQKVTGSNSGSVRFAINNADNAVPNTWLVNCMGEGNEVGSKASNAAVGRYCQLTSEWKRHTMTFYYSGSTSETAKLHLDWFFITGDLTPTSNHKAYVSMPKLEEGDYPTAWQSNEMDKVGKPLRGPMTWTIGETYQGGGFDDEFQDMVVYANSGNMYLCKVTHTATMDNYPGVAVDNGWTESKPWAKTQKTAFVATDVLWSDTLASNVMSAINAQIERLIVNKLMTSVNGGPTLSIHDGIMEISGNTGVKNIEIGVNGEGRAVLRFFDNNGNFDYDLGPGGISNSITASNPSFKQFGSLVSISTGTTGDVYSRGLYAPITNDALTATTTFSGVCQFFDGSKGIENVIYYSPCSDLGTVQNASQASRTHSEYHEKYYYPGKTTEEYLNRKAPNSVANPIAAGCSYLGNGGYALVREPVYMAANENGWWGALSGGESAPSSEATLYYNGTKVCSFKMYLFPFTRETIHWSSTEPQLGTSSYFNLYYYVNGNYNEGYTFQKFDMSASSHRYLDYLSYSKQYGAYNDFLKHAREHSI